MRTLKHTHMNISIQTQKCIAFGMEMTPVQTNPHEIIGYSVYRQAYIQHQT